MGRVVIVGAGPAGASLGYLLARRGVAVTLLERRRDFAREFRGEVLMPAGVAALEEMGLATPLAELPAFVQETVHIYLNGRPLLEGTLDGLRVVAVSQPALLEMLVREAARSRTFDFLRGVSVRGLRRDGGRVVGVRVRTEDGEGDLDADLVVGADGRHSVVRRGAGLTSRHLSPPMDVVWYRLPCPEGWRGVRGYAGRGHLLVAYRTWGEQLQVGWVIVKGTFGELRSRGSAQWVDEMAGHVSPDLADHLRRNRDAVEHPFLLDAVSDCVDRWCAPGVLVIGDAAHTMSPVGAQGINIALRDAIVAANHLLPVLAPAVPDPVAVAVAADEIEKERMPEVSAIQAFQAQPPRVLLSRSWWGEPLRRIVGWLAGRPVVRRRAAARVGDFLYGTTDVRLRS